MTELRTDCDRCLQTDCDEVIFYRNGESVEYVFVVEDEEGVVIEKEVIATEEVDKGTEVVCTRCLTTEEAESYQAEKAAGLAEEVDPLHPGIPPDFLE
jgi:hypothetical protein